MSALASFSDAVAPTQEETNLAKESGRQLARILGMHANESTIKVQTIDCDESITIPVAALRMLSDILNQMAQGNAVTLIPVHAEMTTQEAAALLNVSRPFVIQLLDAGTIPYHRTGTHRRIRFSDIMKYKKAIDSQRLQDLSELAKEAQDLNLGY